MRDSYKKFSHIASTVKIKNGGSVRGGLPTPSESSESPTPPFVLLPRAPKAQRVSERRPDCSRAACMYTQAHAHDSPLFLRRGSLSAHRPPFEASFARRCVVAPTSSPQPLPSSCPIMSVCGSSPRSHCQRRRGWCRRRPLGRRASFQIRSRCLGGECPMDSRQTPADQEHVRYRSGFGDRRRWSGGI